MADEIRFELDPALEMKLHELPEVKAKAVELARKIAQVAQASAPRESGDYAAGITVQETKTGARVYASDKKSAWVEFGIPSRGQQAHWTLRTAAESLGLKFKKGGG